MEENIEEEIVFRVVADPQIRVEDREEAVALLLALKEVGRTTAIDLVNYTDLNKERLVGVAKLLIEKYNVWNQTNSGR